MAQAAQSRARVRLRTWCFILTLWLPDLCTAKEKFSWKIAMCSVHWVHYKQLPIGLLFFFWSAWRRSCKDSLHVALLNWVLYWQSLWLFDTKYPRFRQQPVSSVWHTLYWPWDFSVREWAWSISRLTSWNKWNSRASFWMIWRRSSWLGN